METYQTPLCSGIALHVFALVDQLIVLKMFETFSVRQMFFF